jgi:hypothetical protein
VWFLTQSPQPLCLHSAPPPPDIILAKAALNILQAAAPPLPNVLQGPDDLTDAKETLVSPSILPRTESAGCLTCLHNENVLLAGPGDQLQSAALLQFVPLIN